MFLRLCCVITLLLCCSFDAIYAQTYEWPQWQGPNRDGVSQETGLLQEWPEGGPSRVWLFSDCGIGYSSPAIAGGRLYILGARDGVEQLLALDADTGEELWAAEIGEEYENDWGNGPRSTPTVDGDHIYALGAQGTLVCVTASDGKLVWSATMQDLGGSIPEWGYSESPLIDKNLVLCTPGGGQGAVVAMDKQTGHVQWQSSKVVDRAHYSSIITAEIHGKQQYIQLMPKRLIGLATEDGSLLWETDWPGHVAVVPTPIVRDNRVYITSGYGMGCKLVSIDPDNQVTIEYKNKVMKNHHGGVVLVGDYLYGFSDKSGWVCQDFLSGETAWRERRELGKGAVTFADGKLYCLSESDGHVVLVDAEPTSWQERGRFTLSPQTSLRKPKGKIWSHPVVVDGKLYLRDQELLFCFDVKQ